MSSVGSVEKKFASLTLADFPCHGKIEEVADDAFKRGELSFFDAATKNNQCHLVALKIHDLYEKKKTLSDEERELLHHCFVISSRFSRIRDNFYKYCKLINTTDISYSKYPEMQKTCLKFDKDSISKFATQLLAKPDFPDKYRKEICEILVDDTDIKGVKTFPKFAGAVPFVDELKKRAIPLCCKVKVICPEGYHIHSFTIPARAKAVLGTSEATTSTIVPKTAADITKVVADGSSKAADVSEVVDVLKASADTPKIALGTSKADDEPVCILEGCAILTTAKMSYRKYEEVRDKCFHSYLQDGKTHEENKQCELCIVHEDQSCGELSNYKQRLEEIINQVSIEDFIYEQAADFTHYEQPSFEERYFLPTSKDKKEKLQELYQRSLEKAQADGFSEDNPTVFVVEHAHTDTMKNFNKAARYVDTPLLFAGGTT